MTPWQKAEFQLEEKFEKLADIVIANKNPAAEEVGACITTMIALCQDINRFQSFEEKHNFWITIEDDINDLLALTDSFIIETIK
jgi:hypothetical protein